MASPRHDGTKRIPNLDHRPPAQPTSWCLDESQESIQDTRNRTRGQARAYYCQDTGADFTTVKVWKRYARALTRREQYQHDPDLWNDYDPQPPVEPPIDWSPHEDVPCWEFCQAGDEGATSVWVVTADESMKPPPTTAEWRARKDGDDGR